MTCTRVGCSSGGSGLGEAEALILLDGLRLTLDDGVGLAEAEMLGLTDRLIEADGVGLVDADGPRLPVSSAVDVHTNARSGLRWRATCRMP
jgi:hypothetical protein